MQEEEDTGFDKLSLLNVIGFNGAVTHGLIVHPDKQHLIYPLGCTVVIEDINDHSQKFLHGHTNNVVCIKSSRSGKYLASGQMTHMGFKADIIVWDYKTGEEYAKFVLHKVKVQDLAFSPNEKYLVSLGGQDDGSVVVWSLAKKEAICGSPAQTMSAGITECLAYAHNNDNLFVTGGDGTLRVWDLDVENRKVRPTDVTMGQIKRTIKCLEIGENDEAFYCGTTTGDVLGVNMASRLFQHIGPDKEKFSLGILSLALLKTGEFIVGTGDGTVALMRQAERSEGKKCLLKFVVSNKSQRVSGAVTSISLRGAGHQFFVGTDKCHIYRFNFSEFSHELLNTCNDAAINDVIFPQNTSDLFATCSFEDIRIFHTKTQKELLRIDVPNMICYGMDILKDGSAIISGWNDSRIRAFYPESGKLMFTINEAHKKGVTALAATGDCTRIVSGGGEGQVRVWLVEERPTGRGGGHGRTYVSTLLASMNEHANAVTCMKINQTNTQCVSSSADGTCIVWDLENFRRKQIIFSNTLFRCVCYRPDECQIITSGTDRKIGYWELYDGALIRELDGSRSGAINGMDITRDGDFFVSAGDDKLVKIWRYDEGEVTHVGIGHSTPITRVRICPNQKIVITVSEDGAIFIWKFPF